jgi:hypothetical protein
VDGIVERGTEANVDVPYRLLGEAAALLRGSRPSAQQAKVVASANPVPNRGFGPIKVASEGGHGHVGSGRDEAGGGKG